jgi:hypothetical protein
MKNIGVGGERVNAVAKKAKAATRWAFGKCAAIVIAVTFRRSI